MRVNPNSSLGLGLVEGETLTIVLKTCESKCWNLEFLRITLGFWLTICNDCDMVIDSV